MNGSGDANRLPVASINRLFYFEAGDYIEIFVYTGGIYRDIVGGQGDTFITGYLVST